MIKALGLSASARILEVGCANGWFTHKLTAFGKVTAIDLADRAVAQAKQRVPAATFFCGDFNHYPFPECSFDLVVSLETFSHIDQAAFLERVATILKPGGHLLLTTQNRYVYLRQVWVKPPADGQLRRWVTIPQLKRMAAPRFEVRSCFTVEPSGHRGLLRFVNSRKLNALPSFLIGADRLKRFKEWLGLGQTIVLLARNRGA
jgi:SAM-dependent methyltransferase